MTIYLFLSREYFEFTPLSDYIATFVCIISGVLMIIFLKSLIKEKWLAIVIYVLITFVLLVYYAFVFLCVVFKICVE